MSDLLRVEHLSKSFGANVVLRDIDFVVNPGDVTSIIGASGSGTSTLLRCINLLETPTSGAIYFHDKNMVGRGVNAARYRAKVGSSDYSSASPMMRAILSKVVNEDLTGVMPGISCPTLLIWGANDTATPLSDAKTMEKLIPDAGLVSFDGVGHYSFLENPFQFAAVLKSFLSKDMTKQ